MGLSTSLSTAIGGLNATQAGIGIVSQNVSNANTTGYVRRSIATVDTLSNHSTGTATTAVQRLLDRIVQHQLWQETAASGYTATRAEAMAQVDKLYGAPGSPNALDTIYNGFTSALQALQNDPSSYANRTGVLDAANLLASRLNGLSDGVQQLRMDAESNISTAVKRVNELLGGLTAINSKIVGAPLDQGTASLKDQRDLIVAELAQYVDIRTSEDDRGSLNVVTRSGTQLFDGRQSVTFAFDEHPSISASSQWSSDPSKRGVGTITMIDASGNRSDAIANNVFRSGEIAAHIDLRDKTLVQAQAQLDEIAAQMSRALSEREVPGAVTKTGVASQADLNFDLTGMAPGDTVTFDYQMTTGGPTQRLTFVNVAAGTTLPASAAGDASNRVIGIDFSATPADVATAIQLAVNSATGSGFVVANPSGSVLRIGDGGSASREVVGLAARPTATASGGGTAELPFFVDGKANTAYTGSFEGGSQAVGYAGRITVNAELIANRNLLVQSSATTAQGDATRPTLMLERLTQSQRSLTTATGLDGSTASATVTVSGLVQRVVSSQGQAVEVAKRLNEGQQVALAAVQSRFQDTAKVNVDQEMASLIELQAAYAANARIISTVKEMMDVLMRM